MSLCKHGNDAALCPFMHDGGKLDAMTPNDGGPAFPTSALRADAGDLTVDVTPGMSLRAWLAGKALATMRDRDHVPDAQGMAEECVRRADALIAELRKEQKP